MAAWLGVFAKLQFEKKNGELPAVPRRFLLQDLWMQHKQGSRSWWDWPRLHPFSLPCSPNGHGFQSFAVESTRFFFPPRGHQQRNVRNSSIQVIQHLKIEIDD